VYKKEKGKGFTLLELIVVIIIIGILATLGLTQYSNVVESTRLTEAKVRLGFMRTLTYEYYLKNGSLQNMTNADIGAEAACSPDKYYLYWLANISPATAGIGAERCMGGSGGKPPPAPRHYILLLFVTPSTGTNVWYCRYDDMTGCFGLPPG